MPTAVMWCSWSSDQPTDALSGYMDDLGSSPPSSEGVGAPRLGAHLEAARRRAQLNRAELAFKVGVTEESIRRWERGHTRPSDDRLPKLISVLALEGSMLVSEDMPADDVPPLARRLRDERAS